MQHACCHVATRPNDLLTHTIHAHLYHPCQLAEYGRHLIRRVQADQAAILCARAVRDRYGAPHTHNRPSCVLFLRKTIQLRSRHYRKSRAGAISRFVGGPLGLVGVAQLALSHSNLDCVPNHSRYRTRRPTKLDKIKNLRSEIRPRPVIRPRSRPLGRMPRAVRSQATGGHGRKHLHL